MSEQYVFYPPNRPGAIFHLLAIAILTAAGAWGLWGAFQASLGPIFLLYLLPFLAALLLVPLLLYRLNSLENASYVLERDAIHLRWGLRHETIPMSRIEWLHPAAGLEDPLPLPRFRWPGAVYGTRRYPGSPPVVEYMASRTRDLLVIGTSERLFAISPANAQNFLVAYQHFTEMGSLLSPPARSVHPTFLVARLWRSRPARYLILLGALLGSSVLIWVSIAVPDLEEVSLGFTPSGAPRPPIPGLRLLLLPVLNAFTYLVNLLLGMVFFRRDETQNLAYLLWGSSILVALLFLAAIFFILQVSPA